MQDHAESVADIVRMKLLEAFGTIAALQQEGLTGSDFTKALFQTTGLACEDQRRKAFQLFLYCSERSRIRIVFRNMLCWQLAPV